MRERASERAAVSAGGGRRSVSAGSAKREAREGARRRAAARTVHALGADQRVERLRRLLHRLVESLARRVPLGAQHVVLRAEEALDGAHEDAALASQVRVDLLLKRGRVHVAAADGGGQRVGALLRLARGVLPDGDGGVEALALLEERAQRQAGALGRDEHHVNAGRRHDARVLVKDDGEAVREVQRLARYEQRPQRRPAVLLPRVGQQVHDHAAGARRLGHGQQVHARRPSVSQRRLVRGAALAQADHHLAAIVARVQRLAAALLRAAAERAGKAGERVGGRAAVSARGRRSCCGGGSSGSDGCRQ